MSYKDEIEKAFAEMFGDIDETEAEEIMDNIVKLTDESGEEASFEFLDLIEYEGNEYVVLLPVDDEDGQVVILQIESIDDETESYASVDDDKLLDTLFEIFKEKFKDDFSFEE